MAKQLYDYWFVQFDFPNEEGKPYKSSGGEMVWNKKLKREIPKGWNISLIKDFATTYSGGTPKSTNIEYYKLINNLFDTYLGELPEKFT